MTVNLRTRIIGTGSYLSGELLTNSDLERMVDTSDEWIVERTGIRTRHITPKGFATSDMGAAALKNALEAAGLEPNDLDMIICATVTPDHPMPATATTVQTKIGAVNHCAAFDISAACAGFLYGLNIADGIIRQGSAKNIGVIGAEALTRMVDFEDRTTCVLFGDGAGAVVVTGDTGQKGILSSHLFSDGTLTNALIVPAGGSKIPTAKETVADRQHYIKMNGREVFKYAVRYLSEASILAMERNGLKPEDISWVVPHQANLRILDGVAKRIGIPAEKFVLNLDRIGNTSSASIPIALDEAVREGTVKTDDLLLMIALGGGVSWGSAIIRW